MTALVEESTVRGVGDSAIISIIQGTRELLRCYPSCHKHLPKVASRKNLRTKLVSLLHEFLLGS